jgi:hypothetical protein
VIPYVEIRRARAFADTKEFWNVHRTLAYFAPPAAGLLALVVTFLRRHMGSIASTSATLDVLLPAALYALLWAVLVWALGWAGEFLLNYIWLSPAALHSERQTEISNLIKAHEQATQKLIAANEETKRELTSERAKNSTPVIRGRIIEAFFQDWGSIIMDSLIKGRTLRTSNSWITLHVGLVNVTPSSSVTIENYSLVIETPSQKLNPKREIPFIPFHIDRASRRRRADYPHSEGLLSNEDEQIFELEQYVRSHPLSYGVEVTAFARFVIEDIESLEDAYKDEGVFRLEVEDSLGGIHEIVRPAGPWPDTGSLSEP